jgi:hypothetical protein
MAALTTAPGDYSEVTVQLSFDATTNRSCESIPIEDDDDFEPPENFTVIISSPDPDVTVTPDTSTVVIDDNDGMFFSLCIHQPSLVLYQIQMILQRSPLDLRKPLTMDLRMQNM